MFARREAKFRAHQQTELQALLKRIECRRKEHIKQRELDTKRLLQRNRNVIQVLEGKQAAEAQKLFGEIKKVLYSSAILQGPNAIMNQTKKEQNNSQKSLHNGNKGGSSHQQSQQGKYHSHQGQEHDDFNLPNKAQDHEFMQQHQPQPYVDDEEEQDPMFQSMVYNNETYEDESLGEYATA